jgi:GNAT superfamily N-acetyltransferase
MDVIIRQATKEDCPRMMELIKELAEYEKAPDAVTVDFNHFVESGFGEKPVWWAFVAEVPIASVSDSPSPFREVKSKKEEFVTDNPIASVSETPSPFGEMKSKQEEFVTENPIASVFETPSPFGEMKSKQEEFVTDNPIASVSETPSPFGEMKSKQEEFVTDNPIASVFETPSPFGEGRGEVVAFALYYIRYSTWKGQRLYLEDLIVTDKMRGQGIGKLLLDGLLQECKEKNYSGMLWQVLDWNEPAINFYKKYGNVNFDGEWVNCSIEII